MGALTIFSRLSGALTKSMSNSLSTTEASNAALVLPGEKVDDDFVRPLRFGLIVLILGFGGFVFWAGTAPLDAGEPANGVVEVVGNRKTIQHLEGGTIDAILVKEGDSVQADQVLVRLNPTRAQAELGMTDAQYIVASTTRDRLQAERDNLPNIVFDPAIAARYADDSRYQSAIATQEQLFQTRRQALAGEVSILEENISGAQEQLRGLEQVQASRKTQISFINNQLEGVRALAKDGYLPRNRMLELEREAAQLHAALSSDVVQAGQTRNQIAELQLRVLQRQQDYQKEVQSLLTDVQKESTALADRLAALDYALSETAVRSPIDGTVQNLRVHTVGGVIGSGAPMMEIIPTDVTYTVQAELPVNAIDRVVPGLPVEITFPALNHAQTPNIPGVVLTVSADRITDERTGMPYYKTDVAVTPEGMAMLPAGELRAGMPATVVIKLGERTLFSYLLKPFLDRLHVSLTEK